MVRIAMSDANAQAGTSPDGGGSDDPTQDPKATQQPDELSLARKRQAGAEAARQAAETKAAEFEKELAKYRQAAQTDAEKELSELARTQARLAEAEKRAAEADEKANARILDARFPKAREKFSEITDEVKLTELEALLGDGPDLGQTPLKHNESRTAAAGAPAKEKTAKDIEAELLSMKVPWAQ